MGINKKTKKKILKMKTVAILFAVVVCFNALSLKE